VNCRKYSVEVRRDSNMGYMRIGLEIGRACIRAMGCFIYLRYHLQQRIYKGQKITKGTVSLLAVKRSTN